MRIRKRIIICILSALIFLLPGVSDAYAQGQTWELATGFNFVCLDIDTDSSVSSQTLLEQHTALISVFRFDATTQGFKFQLRIDGANLFGSSFDLNPGDGYVLQCSAPVTIPFSGTSRSHDALQNIIAGFNFLGVGSRAGILASVALADSEVLQSVFRWDTDSASFKFLMKLEGGLTFGEDFPLQNGAGYFFSSTGVSDFKPLATLLAEMTLGADGGNVTAGDFQMQIPAGTLIADTPLAVYEDSSVNYLPGVETGKVYRVDGIPAEKGGIPITIAVSADKLGDENFIVTTQTVLVRGVANEVITVPVFLETQVVGNTLTAMLPAALTAEQSASGAPEFFPNHAIDNLLVPVRYVWQTATYGSHVSTLNKFKIYYPRLPTSMWPHVSTLASTLDEIYAKIPQELGMSWDKRTNWPMQVVCRGLGSASGFQVPDLRGINYYRVDLNSDKIMSAGIDDDMRATAAHEMFHIVQLLNDPRSEWEKYSSASDWVWLEEAASTWIEKHVIATPGFIPPYMISNQRYVLDGLNPPVGSDATAHGYGASSFLSYLTGKAGVTTIGLIFQSHMSGLSPLAAITNQITTTYNSNWSIVWPDYCRALLTAAVMVSPAYPDIAKLVGFLNNEEQFVGIMPGQKLSKTWMANPLSATIFRVRSNAELKPVWNAQLKAYEVPSLVTTIAVPSGTDVSMVGGFGGIGTSAGLTIDTEYTVGTAEVKNFEANKSYFLIVWYTGGNNPESAAPIQLTVEMEMKGVPLPLAITPLDPLIGRIDTQQFTTLLEGVPYTEVNWTVDNGSIDANGLFTPELPGTHTITTTLKSDPQASVTTTVKVAGIAITASAGTPDTPTEITLSATHAPTAPAYVWQFTDGYAETTTIPSLQHTWANAGDYPFTVQMIDTADGGRILDQRNGTVNILERADLLTRTTWHMNGEVESEYTVYQYTDPDYGQLDMMHGVYREWNEEKVLIMEGEFADGKCIGIWQYWNYWDFAGTDLFWNMRVTYSSPDGVFLGTKTYYNGGVVSSQVNVQGANDFRFFWDSVDEL